MSARESDAPRQDGDGGTAGGDTLGGALVVPFTPGADTADARLRARKATERFLRTLDPNAERFDFRTFDDGARGHLPKLFTNTTLAEAWPELWRLNQLGYGIFVMVNATNGLGQKGANVTRVRAVIADCDGVDPSKLVAAMPPHMVVSTSPGKCHPYWLVRDCPLDLYKPLLEAIIAKYGTDKNVKDLPRVLRLPGFYHNKAKPHPVQFDYTLAPKGNMELPSYSVREIIDGLGIDVHPAAAGPPVGGTARRKAEAAVAPCPVAERPIHDFTDAHAIATGERPEGWTKFGPPMETRENVALVRDMLTKLDPDMPRGDWLKVVWSVLATGWTLAPDLARDWSATAKEDENQGQDGLNELVRDFDPTREGAIGFGTLVMMAKHAGYAGLLPGQANAGAIVGAGDGIQRPIIIVEKGEIASTASKAEDALRAAGVPVYQRGGKLVVPVQNRVKLANGKKATTASFKQVDVPTLVDLLNRCADFQRWDARSKKVVSIDPPRDVAETILSRQGEWRFRRIAGCVTAPMLRADGTLLDAPGYDGATELHHFRDPGLTMPAMPDTPTRADAEAALAMLDALLGGFPFVGAIDRAVALSALMTAPLRGGMATAPMHLIRAHTAGTGKSFLVDLATTLAAGHPAPAMSVGKGAEELEKRLGAAMLEGLPFLNLDNANGEVGGEMLCQVTERSSVAVRVLGQSKMPHVECRAAVFCNGNNTTVVGDLVRRTVTCNLDAGMENPEARHFRFDPIARVLAHRGRYLAAILTIARAYRAAGCPEACPPLAPLGSYAEWARAVRAPLVWLGLPDPVASQDAARAEDPVRASIRELIALWEGAPTLKLDTFYKAKQLADAAEPRPDFRDFLFRHCGSGSTLSTKSLGTFLTRIHGRVVDGRKIVMRSDKVRGHLYALTQVDDAG